MKEAIKKVIGFLETASHNETAWLGYQSRYEGISMLQRQLKEIDDEIEKRKHQPFGDSAVYYQAGIGDPFYAIDPLSLTFSEQGIVYAVPEYPLRDSQQLETKKNELTRKDKEIKELRKDNEGLTRELEHEQIHSDNSRRTIEWLTGLRGSFYKSNVDDNE
jgi:hypothetical protein